MRIGHWKPSKAKHDDTWYVGGIWIYIRLAKAENMKNDDLY